MKLKINKYNTLKLISITICLIGFVLLMTGIRMFYIGFHTADMGHNLNLINTKYDLTLMDKASNYKLYTPTELYINGTNNQEKAFFMSIIGMALFSYYFALIIVMLFNKEKEKK